MGINKDNNKDNIHYDRGNTIFLIKTLTLLFHSCYVAVRLIAVEFVVELKATEVLDRFEPD